MQVIDALSQSTGIKNGAPQGSAIGTTSILSIYQQPPACHHCDTVNFRRRRQSGFHTKWPGDSIQVASLAKGLGVGMDSYFSPSIHYAEATSKQAVADDKAIVCATIRLLDSFPLYYTLFSPHFEHSLQALRGRSQRL